MTQLIYAKLLSTTDKRAASLLVLILFIGISLRFHNISERGFILWDEATYMKYAKFGVSTVKNLPLVIKQFLSDKLDRDMLKANLEGSIPVETPKPGHVFLLAIASLLTNSRDYSGSVASAILGVASIFLVYIAGKTFYDHKTGLISASVLAVSPYHIMYSRSAMAEIDASFFFLLGVFFYYLSYREGRNLYLVLSGLCAGFSVTCNYRWIYLILIFFLFEGYLYSSYSEKNLFWKTRRAILLISSLSVFPLLFQFVYLFFLKLKSLPFPSYFGTILNSYVGQSSKGPFLYPHALFFKLILWLEGPIILALLLSGVLYLLRRHKAQDLLIVLPFLIPFTLFSLKTRGDKAVAISLTLPFIALIAGSVIARIPDSLSRFKRMRSSKFLILVPVFMTLLVLLSNGHASWELIKIKSGYREAMTWLKNRNGEKHFTTAYSISSYYVGVKGNTREAPPNLEEIRELCLKEGYRYLLLDWHKFYHSPSTSPIGFYKFAEEKFRPVFSVPNKIATYLPYNIDDFHYRHGNSDYNYQMVKEPGFSYIRIYDLRELLN